MILADKIMEQRKKNGWSQEELAEQMNVSRQSVSKWEGAQSVPDLEKVLKLSKIFGVSTDYLLKDEVTEPEYMETETEETAAVRRVSMEEANAFLQIKKLTAPRIAFATFLCILSPICLIFLAGASETQFLQISETLASGVGIVVLLVMVAAAVAIFISSGAKTSPYEYLEKEVFELEYGVSGMVKERKQEYQEQYTRGNVLGACICILGVIPLLAGAFLENEMGCFFGLCATLVLIGVGVVFFILVGTRQASMKKLLQEDEYTRAEKRNSSVKNAISTCYWLLVVAGYLGYSFYTNDWKTSWIVWPVAGVLYAALEAGMGVLRKNEK